MFDFENKVVVVTGAAGNLGGAVAERFRAAGARLVLVDHRPDRLPRLFPGLADSADHYLATGVDLTEAQAVEGLVEESLARLGRIDVLANVAGGWRGGKPLHETSLETWQFLLDLNARSVFLTSRAVIPAMLEQGQGKIVNVAARVGLKGSKNNAAYSASKGAVVRLTESVSAEVKGRGVNVNCVLPGTIDTPDNRRAMPKADTSRWVPPEAIADVILFLASEAARDVHGAAVPVYGTG